MKPARSRPGANPQYRPNVHELPDFAEAVLDIVDQIPAGTVLSYGDIAELLGSGSPRQVGAVLSRYGSSVTWWRVTRTSGEVPAELQNEALAQWRAEGTALVRGMVAGRRVDMTRARWDGGQARDRRGQITQGNRTQPPTVGSSACELQPFGVVSFP